MEHNALLSRFEAACRGVGLKVTHQRLEIYSELATATDHPSAETLYRRLQKRVPTISLDTVYRTLVTFKQHDLIQKIETVESQARFEIRRERHHHLICKECNEIMDFHWPSIDSAPLPEEIGSWGSIENKNVVVYGICSNCLAKK